MDEGTVVAAGSAIGTLIGFIIILNFIIAIVTTFMAGSRGRSPVAGFFGGLIFGLLSVFYYLLKGDSTELRVSREERARAKIRKELKEEHEAELRKKLKHNQRKI